MAKNKLNFQHHLKLILVLCFLLICGLFYVWGSYYYQKDHQITRIVATLCDPNKNAAAYVVPSNPDLDVTDNKLKPLQNYFKEDKRAQRQLKSNLYKNRDTQQISLIESGTYFLIFPRYVLNVQVYRPQVETNHADSQLSVNGKKMGELMGGGQNYYQDLGLIFPGRYHFTVKTIVSNRKLKADSVTNIWSNKNIDMEIKTGTFQIRSVPKGIVYINDKKVKTLDNYGQAIFHDYPLTKNTELYIETQYHKQKIKSEKVKDLSTAINTKFSNSDDNLNDYGIAPFAGNQTQDVYQDVEGDYIVNPIWPGLITKDEAGKILYNNYLNANNDSFEQGKKDSDYQKLKKELQNFKKNKRNIKLSVQIMQILPINNFSSMVNYQLVYKYGIKDKKQKVFKYKDAVFHQVQGKQLIQTLGYKVK